MFGRRLPWVLVAWLAVGCRGNRQTAIDASVIDAGAIDQAQDPCAGVVCAALDPCHLAGSCDPATGSCSNPAKSDGTPCDDGNACTRADSCQSGVCIGANPIACAALDQCHLAGSCDPATGACSNPAKSDGSACDDGNACTQTDSCQSGVCIGANPIVCTVDQCHVAGSCDPSTGLCPTKPNGTVCDDGDPCTQNDNCQAGVCKGSCPSGVCDTSLSAFTGAKTADWNLNGDASYDAVANDVVLTAGGISYQKGTAIHKYAIAVDTFDVSYDFRMINSPSRGDGVGFMLETDGPTAVGGLGAGLGMTGLSGYGVELDIFNNQECGDVDNNHAGVDTLVKCGVTGGGPTPLATSANLSTVAGGSIGDLGDGQWHTAMVHFASGAMSVKVGGIAVPGLQGVALPGFTSGSLYYFGLSAGTGGNTSRHELRNVQITFPSKRCL